MKNLIISTADNHKSPSWNQALYSWDQIVERLRLPLISKYSREEFLALDKDSQMETKSSNGAYVGAKLKGGTRHKKNVEDRCLLTLDLDSLTPGSLQEILLTIGALNTRAVVHSTVNHTPDEPRVRIVAPLSRALSAKEYVALSKSFCELIGNDLIDKTTHQAERCMFWPVRLQDQEYLCEVFDGEDLDVDMYLSEAEEEAKEPVNLEVAKRNPGDIVGIEGEFCRAYEDIRDAIDTYLVEVYRKSEGASDRYDYIDGSTCAGLKVMEGNKYVYSHHASDPAGDGHLHDAFDIVRIHRFGHLDKGAHPNTKRSNLPSFAAMAKLARKDNLVIAQTICGDKDAEVEPEDLEWMKKLRYTKKGEISKDEKNIETILFNDPELKGKWGYDTYKEGAVILSNPPWYIDEQDRTWDDADTASLQSYLASKYNISDAKRFIVGAFDITLRQWKFNSRKNWYDSIKHDGKPRMDSILIDHFGAEDNIYVREATRKFILAAVMRGISENPRGVKFDYMLILVGPQGSGKTTFFSTLGGKDYSASLEKFEGKDNLMEIQGKAIVEVGELTAMYRSTMNTIKHFLSKTYDSFRSPYGRTVKQYPRRCVFGGTTNDEEFLRDITGNRRFLPIRVVPQKEATFTEEIAEQVWAEAYAIVKAGITEKDLVLSEEAVRIAEKAQAEHMIRNPLTGLLSNFLAIPVPKDWYSRPLYERRDYISRIMDGYEKPGKDTMLRSRICVAEIQEEFLGDRKGNSSRKRSLEISTALKETGEWESVGSARRVGGYGVQKVFERKTPKIAHKNSKISEFRYITETRSETEKKGYCSTSSLGLSDVKEGDANENY